MSVPEFIGRCTKCKEMTSSDSPCCDAPIEYEGSVLEPECGHDDFTENGVCGDCGEVIENIFGEPEINQER